MKSAFLTPLVVQEIDDGDWEVHELFRYFSELLNYEIKVPVGFRTDFASIPRIPIVFDILGDTCHEPAVIHDYLYATAKTDRKTADNVLLEAMETFGIHWLDRRMIYLGVRIGGWKAWNEHRKNDLQNKSR